MIERQADGGSSVRKVLITRLPYAREHDRFTMLTHGEHFRTGTQGGDNLRSSHEMIAS